MGVLPHFPTPFPGVGNGLSSVPQTERRRCGRLPQSLRHVNGAHPSPRKGAKNGARKTGAVSFSKKQNEMFYYLPSRILAKHSLQ